MSSGTTNLFVKKRQALPAYEVAPGTLSALIARIQGWLSRIIGWLFPRHDERVDVLLPLPPQVYGLTTLFQSDPNHDLDAVRVSQNAFGDYRRDYKDRDDWPYPLRRHLARHTGVPSFLNGCLDQPARFATDGPDVGRETAQDWFAQKWISPSLFGVDWGRAAPQLQYVESALIPWPNEVSHSALEGWRGQVCAHVRFEQIAGSWPVFGAQVVAHFWQQGRRISCSSSYFPLRDSLTLKAPADPEQAKQTARRLAVKAVAGELTGIEAIGLYIELLAPFLFVEDKTALGKWTGWHTQVAFTLIQALSQDDPDRFESLAALSQNAPLSDLLHALWEHVNFLDKYRWRISIVPYAGSELFVYPFAGHYYLAYLVGLMPPRAAAPWRVFVDTEQGLILGPPENSALHASFYTTSAAALPPRTPSHLNELVGDLQAEVEQTHPFMRLMHRNSQSQLVPLTLATLPANQAQLLLEGVNIAYHARALFHCFEDRDDLGIDCGSGISASQKITAGLPIQVIVGVGGSQYQMGFTKTDQPPRGQITFQTTGTDPLNSLTTKDNRANPSPTPRVFGPSLDREIILHEFAHAFMWKLRFDPAFGTTPAERPFTFPLLEGYATFFARSLAVRDDFNSHDPYRMHWARAAWRSGDWDSIWAASRSVSIPGADRLPWPNIYPRAKVEGMQAFEVSMVWVRALWDIAWRLANPPVPPNAYDDVSLDSRTAAFKRANRLALNSYFYLHGMTANYELAAEGIVEGVPEPNNSPIQTSVKQALKNRGIYAECGVQALAESPAQSGIGSRLFVGSDQGVALWDGQLANPLVPWNLPDGSDVVALQADANFLYAASECAIWKRALNSMNQVWSKIEGAFPGDPDPTRGEFPADQLPLSIALLNGNVLVGTSDGLWTFRNDEWSGFKRERMAVNMTVNDVEGQSNKIVLVSTLMHYVYVVTGVTAGGQVTSIKVILNNPAMQATSAVIFGRDLYVGTVEGVQRYVDFQPSNGTGSQWSSEIVDDAAVLCLVVDRVGNRVGAGTTNGLYWRNANGTWQPDTMIPPAAQSAIVGCVWRGNRSVIGTLNQGLFVCENNVWKQVVI